VSKFCGCQHSVRHRGKIGDPRNCDKGKSRISSIWLLRNLSEHFTCNLAVCAARGLLFPVEQKLLQFVMTFASKITVTRILMVPIFAVLALAYGHSVASGAANEALRWWALGVFVTAAASDGIDGWIARRFNQMSKFGAFIDPIADKSLLLTGVITLSLVDWGQDGWRLPAWFAATVVARDCIILGGIGILWKNHREVRFAPHWTGKVTTVAQMFALGWVMLRFTQIPPTWPCIVASIFTVWSTVQYLHQGWGILCGKSAD
jgi:CDP-diacylglycerol--glycerol-3-phosphate 3-phosphatidyltransferase